MFPQNNKPQTSEKGKCIIKMKRDKSGRIIGGEISPECTSQQIKAIMREKIIEGDVEEENGGF